MVTNLLHAPLLASRRPARWSGTLRLWLDRAHGRRRLPALDDRLLRDIGLTREQALAEAAKPFWRA